MLVGLAWALSVANASARPLVVASKNFNESYILGEVIAQQLENAGYAVERRLGLGGTLICYEALTRGEVDVYAEYTGTLSQAILQLDGSPEIAELNARLADDGVRLLDPFGFNNTYALVLKADKAQQIGVTRISDLVDVPQLKVVVSHEFLERQDGWPGLSQRYGLPHQVTGIEHGLAYQAINDGAIDITDAYSTDGELERYQLTVLEDDRRFFPGYLAAPLVRTDVPEAAQQLLAELGGTIDDRAMQAMNSAVVFGGRTFAAVAGDYLAQQSDAAVSPAAADNSMWQSLADNTIRHLQLTGLALAAAVLFGVVLSLVTFPHTRVARALVYVCGLMQTIPSIALLALFIPLFGIGMLPAVVALFLYSLLPIVRNALTALTTVDPTLVRVAEAMGLTWREQLANLYVPLALPALFAGVRTAAVISIGTATLAAFIGAGGLGDPIVTGLSLNNVPLILQGAVPAALLAIVTELLFELLERKVLPQHMRA